MKLVALEGTTFGSAVRAIFHLLKGDELVLFDLSMSAKKNKMIARLIENNKIKWVLFIPYDFEVSMAFGVSENVNEYYSNELKSTEKIVSNSEEVLKRYLIEKYSGYYFVRNYLEKHYSDREIVWYQEKKYSSQINKGKSLNVSMDFIGGVNCFFKNFFVNTFLRFVLSMFVASFLVTSFFFKNKKNTKYKYGVLLNFAALLNNKGEFNYTFLLNDKRVQNEDILYILSENVSSDWLMISQQRRENLTSIKSFFQIKTIFSHALEWKYLLSRLKILLGEMFWLQGDPYLKYELIKILGLKLIWDNFYKKFKIKNFIYTNNDGISQIVHNEICRLNGGVSWYYAIFIGGGYLYSKNMDDFERTLHPLWAYQNMDFYLAGGRDVCAYYKMHKQKTKYLEIGNIFSSLANLSAYKQDKEKVFQKYFNQPCLCDYKTISFFDTTFIDSEECFTNYDDAIEFYKDIEKIVLKNLNYFVIVKPAKPDAYYTTGFFKSELKAKVLINIWESLRNNPRVYWAGHSADKIEIIQLADVVVTHALSSPTAEALGAGKKAFWYESMAKHQDTYYSNIPGIIISGFDDLEKRIFNLIYETTDDEFRLFLQKELVPGLVLKDRNSMVSSFVDCMIDRSN